MDCLLQRTNISSSIPALHHPIRTRLPFNHSAARYRLSASAAVAPSRDAAAAEAAKHQLLSRIRGLRRGSAASSWDRALVEEAQVELEAFGGDVDFEKLAGLWRLEYTTADDVRPLAGLDRIPLFPLRIGNIYQRFSLPAEGTVQNIIELSVHSPLSSEPAASAKFIVDARYTLSSGQRIALTFESANLREVNVDSLVLAPALLPRSWLQHQALLALQQLHISVPLRSPRQRRRNQRGNPLGQYQLTYCSDDVLIGRASQGSFVFIKQHQ